MNNNQSVMQTLTKVVEKIEKNKSLLFSDNEKQEIVALIFDYAANIYDINVPKVVFTNKLKSNAEYDKDRNVIHINDRFLEYSSERFLYEVIRMVFHEMNHVFIFNKQQQGIKDYNGTKSLSFSLISEYQLINELIKANRIDAKSYEKLYNAYYFTTSFEKFALISSCKLGLKFIRDLAKCVSLEKVKHLCVKVEERLKNKLKEYKSLIKKSERLLMSDENRARVESAIYEFQKNILDKIYAKKNIMPNELRFIRFSVESGYYDKTQLDNFKDFVFNDKDIYPQFKYLLFATLVCLPSYPICEKDLKRTCSLALKIGLTNNAILKELEIVKPKLLENCLNEIKNGEKIF